MPDHHQGPQRERGQRGDRRLNLTGASAPGGADRQRDHPGHNTISAPGWGRDGIRFSGTNLKILHNTGERREELNGAPRRLLADLRLGTPRQPALLIDSTAARNRHQCPIRRADSSAGTAAARAQLGHRVHAQLLRLASVAGRHDRRRAERVDHQQQHHRRHEKRSLRHNKSTGARCAGNILGCHPTFGSHGQHLELGSWVAERRPAVRRPPARGPTEPGQAGSVYPRWVSTLIRRRCSRTAALDDLAVSKVAGLVAPETRLPCTPGSTSVTVSSTERAARPRRSRCRRSAARGSSRGAGSRRCPRPPHAAPRAARSLWSMKT